MPNIVKITTLFNPLSLLAPHSCRGCGHIGEALCDCCKNYIIKSHFNFCPVCKSKNPTGNCPACKNLPPTFIVERRQDLTGKLIHDLKYSSIRALAKPLAEILNQTLPKLSNDQLVSIIPLPTISRHIRARGLDHTHLIAKHLARLRNNNNNNNATTSANATKNTARHPYRVEKALLRAKNTVQVGANAKTRLQQAKTAYALNPKFQANPTTTYILLDDVWTTGASMKSAVKKLRETGAQKILIAILAVS